MSEIRKLSDHDFLSQLGESQKLWLIDCWSMRCEECRFNSPVFAELFSKCGDRYEFAKLNVDENPYIASHFQSRIVPAFLHYDPKSKETRFLYGNPTLDEVVTAFKL